MNSIDLRKCAPICLADSIFAKQVDASAWTPSDDADGAFTDATAGLSCYDVELLRSFAIATGHIRTLADLDRMCHALGDSKAGRRMRAVLRRIGKRGREQLSHEGVEVDDLLRSLLTLLFAIPESELDDLVRVMSNYGKDGARECLMQIDAALRGSSVGESLRHAFGFTREPLRCSAKRAHVSGAAISKNAKRIRRKLHGKG